MEQEGAGCSFLLKPPALTTAAVGFLKRVIKCNTTSVTVESQNVEKKCVTDL